MLLASTLFGLNVLAQSSDFITRPPKEFEINYAPKALMDKPVLLGGAKAAFGIVLPELSARYLDKCGKKKEAKIVRIGIILMGSYGTFTNVRGQIRRAK